MGYTVNEVISVTTKQMVKTALTYAGMTQAELARRLKTTPSNLNQKLQRNTLTREDLTQIAAELGAEYVCYFRFEDGTEI